MYWNKEFVHQVGKKDYHYIRMHGQQNIKTSQKCFTSKFHVGLDWYRGKLDHNET